MTRISIQGLLVGPDYDDPIFARDIANGVFCPSSKVLRDIDEAQGDDLEIHINSEGGDVLSYNEVANRIKSYPGNVQLVIGACAFSEAANLTLLSQRPVKCHKNTIMLWHSAMTPWLENAAPGELRSEAEMIDRINAPVKAALKEHGVPEEHIEEGFRDGSSLVLGADELVHYGIAELIDDNGESLYRVNEALSMRIAALADASQRIAARFKVNNQEMSKKKASKKAETEEQKVLEEQQQLEEQETVSAEEPQEEEKPQEEAQEDQPQEEDKPHEETEEKPADEEPQEEETQEEEQTEETEEEEKPQEEEEDEMTAVVKALEGLTATINELTSKNADIEKRLCGLEQQLTEKEVEVQEAKKALKAERTKRIGAIAKALTGTNASESTPVDWPAAVKACDGDKMLAYKKWPQLAKAWANQ